MLWRRSSAYTESTTTWTKVALQTVSASVTSGNVGMYSQTISVVDRGAAKLKDTFPGPAGAIAISNATGDVWVSGSNGTEVWRFSP